MDYTVHDISPVQKEVKIKVPAEEVNASITATTALMRNEVDIKGFRKGKVPSSVIESRFKKKIYGEAAQELINLHINQIMSEIKVQPLSRIDLNADEMVRDEDFEYSISFEVAPEFDLPEYKGLTIEEEDIDFNQDQVDKVIDRIRNNLAELELVEEDRNPEDGEVVVIDFQASQGGVPVEGVKAENFQLTLGEGNALESFEEIVKGLTPGQTGEKEVTLPDDFLNPVLAGQTVDMKVTLKSIKLKKLPELDDELARKAGGFESFDQLKKVIEDSYKLSQKNLKKSDALKKAVDKLKDSVQFELPPSMVSNTIENKIAELKDKLERQGKNFESLGKTREDLEKEFQQDAEDLIKSQLFLLAIAKAEEITVNEQEVDEFIRGQARSKNLDFQQLKSYYESNNLMFAIRDSLIADKASEHIYKNAEVKIIPPSMQASSDEKADA
ncbi:trigger factor [Desulfonatronovibrio magnus]|uniref:trigger factor n=1 Tax=Desulfonatronovibrio magnus TaxID=698827 RepID=UPI0005EBC217|nr:trigger factor [Desulfonatronovibrio magnus]RQD56936.1 MAG: trigger factor [Desulfonatronovibrio sp. MSAO_Bac4]